MTEKEILDELIVGYRRWIEERYQHDRLAARYDLPTGFDAERVARFRTYFLEQVYPEPRRRDELNEAFGSLENYLKQPKKLLQLLKDSSRVLLKFGRHFPKIFNAGLAALRSFLAGSRFERQLVNRAIRRELFPPYSTTEIEQLVRSLDAADIEAFIDNNRKLFEVLKDRPLVKRIVQMLDILIQKMEARPQIYSDAEINGLRTGRALIVEGDALFDELSPSEQQLVFDMVVKIEEEAVLG